MKIFITSYDPYGSASVLARFAYTDGGSLTGNQTTAVDVSTVTNNYDFKVNTLAAIQQWAVDNSLSTVNDGDIYWMTSPDAPIQSSVSHSLNSAFQVSSTKNSTVNYSVDIATSLSLSGGAVGTVFLEICASSGFSSGVQEVGRYVNGQTGTLTLGLSLSQTGTANLSGFVPAGYYVRLRTANTTGTPTFTYRSGQETVYASN